MLAIALLYLERTLDRHTTRNLVWASIGVWDLIVVFALYLWWWSRRGTIGAVITGPSRRARMLLLLAVLTSGLASGALVAVGVRLLEQDSLGPQVVGVLPLAIVCLVVPGWALWFYLWASRARRASSSDPGIGG